MTPTGRYHDETLASWWRRVFRLRAGVFFGAVEALLSPSDGVLVMEAITVPEVTQHHVM